jgi:RNA polymerase sigma-70 factor (ECF subfamily)
LFTTAYHLVIDYTRRQKFKGDVKEISNTPSHTPNYNNAQEILEQLVNELPEIQKAVIMLRDYEGYSYQEIAEITSLNESQVKVYIFRARKYLKERIGSMEALI